LTSFTCTCFCFLVLELAEIDDAANRRLGHRGNLDQVDSRFLGQCQCCPDTHDSQLLAIQPDEPNFRCVDFFVNALRLLQCDGSAPCFDKN
jgi:hypothetical protein